MKVTCNLKSLAEVFQQVSGVCPNKTTKDLLKYVSFKFTKTSGTLSGTDSEIGMRADVPDMSATDEGHCLLPVDKLTAILKEVSGETITFNVTERAVIVKCGSSEFRLSAVDPTGFPDIEEFTDEAYWVVRAGDFRRLISHTKFSVDDTNKNRTLGGMLLEFEGNICTIATTDGRRLSVSQSACTSIGVPTCAPLATVCPVKAMALIERCLDGDGDVKVSIRPNEIILKYRGVSLSAKLVQGRFIKYKNGFPAKEEQTATIQLVASPFYSAVRQSQIVSNPETASVEFKFTKGSLSLNSEATDVGQSEIVIPIGYDGDEFSMRFSPRYLSDFLRVIDGASAITMIAHGPDRQAIFQCGDYRYGMSPICLRD